MKQIYVLQQRIADNKYEGILTRMYEEGWRVVAMCTDPYHNIYFTLEKDDGRAPLDGPQR